MYSVAEGEESSVSKFKEAWGENKMHHGAKAPFTYPGKSNMGL